MVTVSHPLADSAGSELALPSVTIEEPAQAACSAGLRYICDARPGFGRRRCGRGFTYLDEAGDRIADPAQLKRLKALIIPLPGKRCGFAPSPTVICWPPGATLRVAKCIATIPTGVRSSTPVA